jgi:large conductance mechanosensitive channel
MSLIDDFKSFMKKGNVIDLAVAVALGAAFSDLVKAFVYGLVMPMVSYVLPARMAWEEWTIGKLRVGLVLGAATHFVLISSVVFVLCIKLLGRLLEAEAEVMVQAPTRICPRCLEPIRLGATRCKFCTSEIGPAQSGSASSRATMP